MAKVLLQVVCVPIGCVPSLVFLIRFKTQSCHTLPEALLNFNSHLGSSCMNQGSSCVPARVLSSCVCADWVCSESGVPTPFQDTILPQSSGGSAQFQVTPRLELCEPRLKLCACKRSIKLCVCRLGAYSCLCVTSMVPPATSSGRRL
jgi:hypothetical protein